jgi:hypothetical protein
LLTVLVQVAVGNLLLALAHGAQDVAKLTLVFARVPSGVLSGAPQVLVVFVAVASTAAAALVVYRKKSHCQFVHSILMNVEVDILP